MQDMRLAAVCVFVAWLADAELKATKGERRRVRWVLGSLWGLTER